MRTLQAADAPSAAATLTESGLDASTTLDLLVSWGFDASDAANALFATGGGNVRRACPPCPFHNFTALLGEGLHGGGGRGGGNRAQRPLTR